jgi:hypothetical protein
MERCRLGSSGKCCASADLRRSGSQRPIFIEEKSALLAQEFEVKDDVIYANTEAQAIEKYRSNITYVVQKYPHANGIYTFCHCLLVIGVVAQISSTGMEPLVKHVL